MAASQELMWCAWRPGLGCWRDAGCFLHTSASCTMPHWNRQTRDKQTLTG
jgi:hypothetical protein